MAKVLVVMAAYNAAETIREAVESVQNQSFVDWELIVVDDASTDGTSESISQFLDDPRIRLVKNSSNLGAGRSRNTAISASSAPLVAVMDADDLSLPRRLELQVREFDDDPTLSVLSAQVAEFGNWGGPAIGHWPTSQIDIQDRIRRAKMPVAHCAAMFRRDVVMAVGGYDEECRRAEDFALFRRLNGQKFRSLASVLVLYRTSRPLRLRYAITSGRDGRMARVRTRTIRRSPSAQAQRLPASLGTDVRSVITWARRRIAEGHHPAL